MLVNQGADTCVASTHLILQADQCVHGGVLLGLGPDNIKADDLGSSVDKALKLSLLLLKMKMKKRLFGSLPLKALDDLDFKETESSGLLGH